MLSTNVYAAEEAPSQVDAVAETPQAKGSAEAASEDADEEEDDDDEDIVVLTEKEKEEKLEERVSAKMIQDYGEKWEKARKCYQKEIDSDSVEHFVDQLWMKENIHYIDEERYVEFILNAPKDSKPWLLDFGTTPLGRPESDKVTEGRIELLICLSRYLGDEFHFGFGDYRKSENILESYDFEWGQYGSMAPLSLYIEGGQLYQFAQRNFAIFQFAEAVKRVKEDHEYSAPVVAPRNELNIFWEYAKRDLGKMRLAGKFDKWVRNTFDLKPEDHYVIDQYVTLPLFSRTVSDKNQGLNIMLFFILPAIILLLLILRFICVKTCCRGKNTNTSKVDSAGSAARPSSRGKREKVE